MLNTALRDHQMRALSQWEKSSGSGFALFMEQRTGKTLTALAIIDRVKPRRLLVVCPKRAVSEWTAQTAKHLTPEWGMEMRVYTFGEAMNRKKTLRSWIQGGAMICDESHRIKSPSSKWSRAVRYISRLASYRLALTGTPIAQGVHDAWAQFDFLDPAVFGTWKAFKTRYCLMGGFRGKQVVGNNPATLPEFNEKFHQHSYRDLLRDVQDTRLKVRHTVHKFQLGREWTHYRELEEELRTYVNGVTVETPLIITKAIKLQQLTGGFLIDEETLSHQVGDAKLRAFIRLVDSLLEKHLVIAYRFNHERDALQALANLRGRSTQTINGQGNNYDRQNPADWILLQVQSGIAIDLSSARSIVFYSWDFSYLNYEQLKSRVLFYNVEKAHYHYLVAEGTIDEVILEAVRRKKKFADLVCDRWRKTHERYCHST